jgi:hypothetical protein
MCTNIFLGMLGGSEFLLVIFSVLILPATLILVIYLMIDRWVTKNVNVKKETNELLKEIIRLLDKTNK